MASRRREGSAPAPDEAARKALCGTWRLVSLELRTPSGELQHPLGRDASGYLFYNEQGFMSAAMMGARRAQTQSSDLAGTQIPVDFNAYCGRFEVRGDRIIHHVEVSSVPQWSGRDQERIFKLDNDRLILESPPLTIASETPIACLIWERV